jgi:isoleucyl-tRNA synthetase
MAGDPQVNYQEGDNILDRWIISRSQTLIQQVTEQMESYQLYNVVPALFDFIEDLTNTYIRLNRRRFWADGLEADKAQAYSTLYQSLVTLSKLMAPFAPFLSDYIYLELSKLGGLQEESVHLESYPESLSEKANTSLEDAVERMKQILILGRQQRNKKQIKVKTPLKDLVIIHQDKSLLENISQLESYIKTELNIKQVNYSQDEDKYINLFCKPNSPVLGKRLGKKFGPMRGKLKNSALMN